MAKLLEPKRYPYQIPSDEDTQLMYDMNKREQYANAYAWYGGRKPGEEEEEEPSYLTPPSKTKPLPQTKTTSLWDDLWNTFASPATFVKQIFTEPEKAYASTRHVMGWSEEDDRKRRSILSDIPVQTSTVRMAEEYKYGEDIPNQKLKEGIASGVLEVIGDNIFRRYRNSMGNWTREVLPIAKITQKGDVKPVIYTDNSDPFGGFGKTDGTLWGSLFKKGEDVLLGPYKLAKSLYNIAKNPAGYTEKEFTKVARSRSPEDISSKEGLAQGLLDSYPDRLARHSRQLVMKAAGDNRIIAGDPYDEMVGNDKQMTAKGAGQLANRLYSMGVLTAAGVPPTLTGAMDIPEYVAGVAIGNETPQTAALKSAVDVASFKLGALRAAKDYGILAKGIGELGKPAGKEFGKYIVRSAVGQAKPAILQAGGHTIAEGAKMPENMTWGEAGKNLGYALAVQTVLDIGINMFRGRGLGNARALELWQKNAPKVFDVIKEHENLPVSTKDLFDLSIQNGYIPARNTAEYTRNYSIFSRMREAAREVPDYGELKLKIDPNFRPYWEVPKAKPEPNAVVKTGGSDESMFKKDETGNHETTPDGQYMYDRTSLEDLAIKIQQRAQSKNLTAEDKAAVKKIVSRFPKGADNKTVWFDPSASNNNSHLQKLVQIFREHNGIHDIEDMRGITPDDIIDNLIDMQAGRSTPAYMREDPTNLIYHDKLTLGSKADYPVAVTDKGMQQLLAEAERATLFKSMQQGIKEADPTLDDTAALENIMGIFGLTSAKGTPSDIEAKFIKKTEGMTYGKIAETFNNGLKEKGLNVEIPTVTAKFRTPVGVPDLQVTPKNPSEEAVKGEDVSQTEGEIPGTPGEPGTARTAPIPEDAPTMPIVEAVQKGEVPTGETTVSRANEDIKAAERTPELIVTKPAEQTVPVEPEVKTAEPPKQEAAVKPTEEVAQPATTEAAPKVVPESEAATPEQVQPQGEAIKGENAEAQTAATEAKPEVGEAVTPVAKAQKPRKKRTTAKAVEVSSTEKTKPVGKKKNPIANTDANNVDVNAGKPQTDAASEAETLQSEAITQKKTRKAKQSENMGEKVTGVTKTKKSAPKTEVQAEGEATQVQPEIVLADKNAVLKPNQAGEDYSKALLDTKNSKREATGEVAKQAVFSKIEDYMGEAKEKYLKFKYDEAKGKYVVSPLTAVRSIREGLDRILEDLPKEMKAGFSDLIQHVELGGKRDRYEINLPSPVYKEIRNSAKNNEPFSKIVDNPDVKAFVVKDQMKDYKKAGAMLVMSNLAPDDDQDENKWYYDALKGLGTLGAIALVSKSMNVRSRGTMSMLAERIGDFGGKIKGSVKRTTPMDYISRRIYDSPAVQGLDKAQQALRVKQIMAKNAIQEKWARMMRTPADGAASIITPKGEFGEGSAYGKGGPGSVARSMLVGEDDAKEMGNHVEDLYHVFSQKVSSKEHATIFAANARVKQKVSELRMARNYNNKQGNEDIGSVMQSKLIRDVTSRESVISEIVAASKLEPTGKLNLTRDQAAALYDKAWADARNYWDALSEFRMKGDVVAATGIRAKELEARKQDLLKQVEEIKAKRSEVSKAIQEIKKKKKITSGPEGGQQSDMELYLGGAELRKLRALQKSLDMTDYARLKNEINWIDGLQSRLEASKESMWMDTWEHKRFQNPYAFTLAQVEPGESISGTGRVYTDSKVHPYISKAKHTSMTDSNHARRREWERLKKDLNAVPVKVEGEVKGDQGKISAETGYWVVDAVDDQGRKLNTNNLPIDEYGGTQQRVTARMTAWDMRENYAKIRVARQQLQQEIMRAMKYYNVKKERIASEKNLQDIASKLTQSGANSIDSGREVMDAITQLQVLLKRAENKEDVISGIQDMLEYSVMPMAPKFRPDQNYTGWQPQSVKEWIKMGALPLEMYKKTYTQKMSRGLAIKEIDKQLFDNYREGLFNSYTDKLLQLRQDWTARPAEGFFQTWKLKTGDEEWNIARAANAITGWYALKTLVANPLSFVKNIEMGNIATKAVAASQGIQFERNKARAMFRSGGAMMGLKREAMYAAGKDGELVNQIWNKYLKRGVFTESPMVYFAESKTIKQSWRDKLYFVQRAAEFWNRADAAMIYSLDFIKKHPKPATMSMDDYIDDVVTRGSLFTAQTQGRFSLMYRSQTEREWARNPMLRNIITMMSPAFRQLYTWEHLVDKIILNPNPGARAASVKALGAMAAGSFFFGGSAAMPLAKDAWDILSKIHEIASGDSNEENIAKQTLAEEFWAKTKDWATKTYNIPPSYIDKFRTAIEYGPQSLLLGKDISWNDTFGGYFSPFIVSTISKQLSSLSKSDKGFFGWLIDAAYKNFVPVSAERAAHGVMMGATGEYLDKDFQETRRKAGWDDGVMYFLFNRDLIDNQAMLSEMSEANPIQTPQQKREFVTKLFNRSGLKYNGKKSAKIEQLLRINAGELAKHADNLYISFHNTLDTDSFKEAKKNSYKKLDKYVEGQDVDNLIQLLATKNVRAAMENAGRLNIPLPEETDESFMVYGKNLDYGEVKKSLYKDASEYVNTLAAGLALSEVLRDIDINYPKRFTQPIKISYDYQKLPSINGGKIKDYPFEDQPYEYALFRFMNRLYNGGYIESGDFGYKKKRRRR